MRGRLRGRVVPACVACGIVLLWVPWVGDARQAAPADGDRVVLVTLDGVRQEELFGGLDVEALRSTLREKETLEEHATYRRFWAASPEERRKKLLPFFWGTLMTEHGSVAGNRTIGSAVRLTNRHWFSYPGYAEILLGEAHDDKIASNDAVQNPYVTVLEGIRERLKLPLERVATFGSWGVFNEIAEHTKGATFVNAGQEAFAHADPVIRQLSAAQFETQPPWDVVRFDAYTFRFAMAHLAAARPRALYIAFDETDDWAHDGKYGRLLEAYVRTDGYLRELWTWLQSQPDYRGRTHLLITTDHGRGRTAKDWRDHGAKVEGAEDVFIAFVSPGMKKRGEWRDHPLLTTSQIAATLARWVGVDWKALNPRAGDPIALDR
jgi:hypothetical protein